MPWVLPKILRPINHISLASKKVNPQWNTFIVNLFLCAFSKVLWILKAFRVHHTSFEHFSVLLTQHWVLFLIWLKVFFPKISKSHLIKFKYGKTQSLHWVLVRRSNLSINCEHHQWCTYHKSEKYKKSFFDCNLS